MTVPEARRPKSHPEHVPLRLESNLDAFPTAACLIDLDGVVGGWNSAAQALFGTRADAVIGRKFMDLEVVRRLPGLAAELPALTRAPRHMTIAEKGSGQGGLTLLRITLAPVTDDRGRVGGLLLVAEDRREAASMDAALRVRDEDLEAAQRRDQRKDDFLAMLAHELRNPLAAIVNATHIIGMHAMRDIAVRQAQTVVGRQVKHMVRLLDDLLDVARITRGLVELQRVPMDLRAAVGDALDATRPKIQAGVLRLSVAMPDSVLPVIGDLTRLTQVIGNLLHNAAKYTSPGGEIRVTASADGDQAVLSVADTGMGIAPEMLPKVFDLFSQADSSLARSHGGLGIGLTLVRTIVELHGGSVAVHSAGLGLGSEFVVRLPVAVGVSVAEAPVSPASVRSGRRSVLVIEDNRDAREMLRAMLELYGHVVRVARDGEEGITVASTMEPEVAVIDVGLPGLNGYEVARQLRARLGHRVRLVALTGYGGQEAKGQALEAGFDVHLVKPVDPVELIPLLEG